MAVDRSYYATLADARIAASFPGTSATPPEYLDFLTGRSPDAGSFTIPASPYTHILPVATDQATMTILVGAAARVIVPGDTTPAVGQVSYDAVSGVVVFNAADTGLTCNWTATWLVSMISASDLYKFWAELLPLQDMFTSFSAVEGVLASLGSISLTATGNHDLWTATADCNPTAITIERESGTGAMTVEPKISVGTNSPDYDNIVLGNTLYAFDNSDDHVYHISLTGIAKQISNTDDVKFRVQVASDVVSQSVKVYLRGFLR